MIRRTHTALIALAALVALGYQEATSQERMPAVPSKQIPPSSASLDATVPVSALVDTSIERTSQRRGGGCDRPARTRSRSWPGWSATGSTTTSTPTSSRR